MKKLIVILLAVCAVSPALARPHRPAPPPRFYHHHHHHYRASDTWAAAGVGLAAGVVGAALYNAVKSEPEVVVQQPAPVVVQQPAPVVVQQPVQNVWVEGRYVQQVQPNGTVVQVWQPGHYEQR